MAIAPLAIAGIAAVGGFLKEGGLQGIIGSGKRKREEQAAQVEQRERQFEYENFDFNQDVGDIYNPYAQVAQQQQQFQQENIDKASARLIDQHERAGVFGATTGVLNAQTEASRQAGQQVAGIRAQGAQFVEQQRQSRIQKRYDQAGTFLARADNRLAQAKMARQRANDKLLKGIGAGVAAGASAGFSGATTIGGGLEAAGIIPSGTIPGGVGGGGNFNPGDALALGGETYATPQFNTGSDPAAFDPNSVQVLEEELDPIRIPSVVVGQHQITDTSGYTDASVYGY